MAGPTRCTVPSTAVECPVIRTVGYGLLVAVKKITVISHGSHGFSEQMVSGNEQGSYCHFRCWPSYYHIREVTRKVVGKG